MKTLLGVLLQPKYALLLIISTVVMLILSAWLPNLYLVETTIFSTSLSFGQKIKLLTSLAGSLWTNFSFMSLFITFSVAILTGLQVSLLAYYLHSRIKAQKEMGMSFVGVMTGILGIGCASCGSVLLTSMLGLGFASSFLVIFPLRGQEFGFLGIALLLWANSLLVKKILSPSACGFNSGFKQR